MNRRATCLVAIELFLKCIQKRFVRNSYPDRFSLKEVPVKVLFINGQTDPQDSSGRKETGSAAIANALKT